MMVPSVEHRSDNFKRVFGHKLRDYKSRLEPNDHSELDLLSPELDDIASTHLVSIMWHKRRMIQ